MRNMDLHMFSFEPQNFGVAKSMKESTKPVR